MAAIAEETEVSIETLYLSIGGSFYVRDPDGNACEVYWPTGRRSAGANRPIDLRKSEGELLELIRS